MRLYKLLRKIENNPGDIDSAFFVKLLVKEKIEFVEENIAINLQDGQEKINCYESLYEYANKLCDAVNKYLDECYCDWHYDSEYGMIYEECAPDPSDVYDACQSLEDAVKRLLPREAWYLSDDNLPQNYGENNNMEIHTGLEDILDSLD